MSINRRSLFAVAAASAAALTIPFAARAEGTLEFLEQCFAHAHLLRFDPEPLEDGHYLVAAAGAFVLQDHLAQLRLRLGGGHDRLRGRAGRQVLPVQLIEDAQILVPHR